MGSDNVLLAFGLTLFAGLSTGIGSALAFFTRATNTRFLSLALGFSAGVMIFVSFVEMLPQARHFLSMGYGAHGAGWAALAAFLSGMAAVALIDALVPSFENPHEPRLVEDMGDPAGKREFDKLYRSGVMTALAIGIHNFPEGLATFTAALSDPSLGVSVALAIAIHNIPEGIAVSVPIFYATGSRMRGFTYSFLSGLAEPAGALIGYLLLRPFLTDTVFGMVFAAVAGVMVFISLDELLPSAREYCEHHLEIYGLMAGMAVMGASLLLLD